MTRIASDMHRDVGMSWKNIVVFTNHSVGAILQNKPFIKGKIKATFRRIDQFSDIDQIDLKIGKIINIM